MSNVDNVPQFCRLWRALSCARELDHHWPVVVAFLSVERLREDAMARVDRQQRSFLRRDFMRSVLAGAGAVAAHGTVWRKSAWADPAACDGSSDLALVNGKILT